MTRTIKITIIYDGPDESSPDSKTVIEQLKDDFAEVGIEARIYLDTEYDE